MYACVCVQYSSLFDVYKFLWPELKIPSTLTHYLLSHINYMHN